VAKKIKERGVVTEPKPDRDQAAAARMSQRIAESEEKARAFAACLDPRQFQGDDHGHA